MGRGEPWPSDRQRGAEKGWERDDKGRVYRLEAGARVYRSEADRDAALEEVYTARPCETTCCRSILAGVAAHQDQLVQLYMQWCQSRDVREAYDSEPLARWEREQFGARLYRAAHGVLLYAVRVARFGPPRYRERQARLQDGLTDEQRRERMLLALSAVADDKAMPGRITGREWDERRARLREQARLGDKP